MLEDVVGRATIAEDLVGRALDVEFNARLGRMAVIEDFDWLRATAAGGFDRLNASRCRRPHLGFLIVLF